MEFRRLAFGLAILLCPVAPAEAQTPRDTAAAALSDLARVESGTSRIEDFGSDLHVELTLTRPVPWQVFTLDDPRRLVLDFSEVAFRRAELLEILHSDIVTELRPSRIREGWSRLVLDLAQPMRIETAGLATGAPSGAVLKLQLAPTSDTDFAARSGAPDSTLFRLPRRSGGPGLDRDLAGRPLRVALDPGHGGFDPGAEAGGLRESVVTMTFARELARVLEDAGMEVTLTRTADDFVPLTRRVSIARATQADLFVSLHADALEDGAASGAAVYTLSDAASDAASRKLAERLDRSDLILGVDPGPTDDAVAVLLMDLARRQTRPRAERLADSLVDGLAQATGDLHKRPRLRAGFSVLRAADIPSVLVELGFLSSAGDRAKLADPAWRSRTAHGLRQGIEDWAADERARRGS